MRIERGMATGPLPVLLTVLTGVLPGLGGRREEPPRRAARRTGSGRPGDSHREGGRVETRGGSGGVLSVTD